jgi:Putative auto-transporter adhesin, head GIN domain
MCKKIFLKVLLLVAAITLTACNAGLIKGSGDLVTETRQVSNYDRITLSGSGEVIVTQSGSESLSIETDDNVMKHIKVEVKNGTLTLGFEEGFKLVAPSRLVFSVGVDDLTGLAISGSGDVESDRIETDRLDVTVSGSGDVQIGALTASEVIANISGSGEINLEGDADSQDVTISGSGKYLVGDVCSASVKVNISGSGDATVCATEALDSEISGSGSVNYYGRPALNSSNSGSGKINSLGEK